MRVDLKTITFPIGLLSLTIDNAVLGEITKRLLITMLKNKELLGSLDTIPFHFVILISVILQT